MCIHGCLLYNLAGSVDGRQDIDYHRKVSNTRRGLLAELDIGSILDCGIVVHIGSCKNKKEGIASIAENIEYVLTQESALSAKYSKEASIPIEVIKSNRKIYLENAAGEGNKIGSTLDEIGEILKLIPPPLQRQVEVCIDTAHIFGAGQYDLGVKEDVTRFYDEFSEKVGLQKLKLFHFNDSRVPYGSKKDRHENLGLGYIFNSDDEDRVKSLQFFVEEASKRDLPLIGEPPGTDRYGNKGLGGFWDYQFLRHIMPLDETFLCE